MLDAKTGLFLWAAETLTLAVLLGTLWLHRPSRPHNLYFAAGFIATGTGTILIAMRGDIASFLSIEVGNTLTLAAFGFWLAGLMTFEQRKLAGWIAIPALIWIAGMFLQPVRENMVSRILLYQGCAAIGYFMLAAIVLKKDAPNQGNRKALAAILVFQAVSSAITAFFVLPKDMSSSHAIPLTVPLAFSSALGFTAIIMISAKIMMEETERRLNRLAMTDHLTGVLNRRGLAEEFDRIKSRVPAAASHVVLTVFDIDHFKKINDRHGHQAGDAVLVHFCHLAAKIINERGLFVRMGGEEFALICAADDPAQAIILAENIRMALCKSPILAEGQQIQVTVSAGIADSVIGEADLNKLLTEADRALYSAKKSGRNRTVVNRDSMNIVVPAVDRQEDPMDNNADRQVAALNKIAAIANR
ncbi:MULTISPECIES: GGDEF domain-containing protein [Rhizobium/Agrobacterium group]|uniref:GGDEF domain-containing protein n=1 Tax=Rhizobium/Agrobacterium group TaxID=227290 RepID=UPI00110E55A6|nr:MULTISPECIES: GGDEF domain-containing protein [Rhizobium/Agrobacterium group]NWJ22890.1 GGDEF domain-containing protein [Rhizobium sp. RM]TMV12213.1 GGDEF domain-containing protein [Rhizobium sp. Td3]UXS00882.1 GGDEF domain-containing protein [Agrobacterium tumefaciens]